MTPSPQTQLRQAALREEAHRRAVRQIVFRVRAIRQHLQDQNVGLALDELHDLTDALPHPDQPVEYNRLYEDALEQLTTQEVTP